MGEIQAAQAKLKKAAAKPGADVANINKEEADFKAKFDPLMKKECMEADIAAQKKCLAKPAAEMVAEEPQQMLAGFCGFLAGAAVVGLAAGLKKRSQTPLDQPLTA